MAGTTVILDGLFFGEGPRWRDGRLWFSDFYDHAVRTVDLTGRSETVLEVPGQPSGIGWLPDGRLLVVSMTDRRVLRREHDGTVVEHADLSAVATFHCNDMVVDAFGRAYVGNFGFDLDAVLSEGGPEAALAGQPTADVARVDPDGTVSVAVAGRRFPNGTVITPDGRTMIMAETLALRLTAFTVATDGTLGEERVWADLAGPFVVPDGICLDAEGRVWVANALAPEVVLVAPGGEIVERVTTGRNCYACMLGGPAGRHLFAMTAHSSHAMEAGAAREACVEVVEVAVPHAGLP
jgi:sugar lactone lactonase YvrE